MFKNKSVEFCAAAKTAGLFGLVVVCGVLGSAMVEVFGINSILYILIPYILYQLAAMVYNSYLYSLKYEDRQQAKND
jgi:hypothetical protein